MTRDDIRKRVIEIMADSFCATHEERAEAALRRRRLEAAIVAPVTQAEREPMEVAR